MVGLTKKLLYFSALAFSLDIHPAAAVPLFEPLLAEEGVTIIQEPAAESVMANDPFTYEGIAFNNTPTKKTITIAL